MLLLTSSRLSSSPATSILLQITACCFLLTISIWRKFSAASTSIKTPMIPSEKWSERILKLCHSFPYRFRCIKCSLSGLVTTILSFGLTIWCCEDMNTGHSQVKFCSCIVWTDSCWVSVLRHMRSSRLLSILSCSATGVGRWISSERKLFDKLTPIERMVVRIDR